jgi:uncharacterized delta-60 repeat protein
MNTTINNSIGTRRSTFRLTLTLLLVSAIVLTTAQLTAAQNFTFMGDYDKSFAAPNGYFVEPQNNLPGDAAPARQTLLFTGDYAPDGSVIAGGRILTANAGGDFWLRKFTPSGAVDTSFGGGAGYVRTIFSTDVNGNRQNSGPVVLKRQADGKIVFAGRCTLGQQTAQQTISPGTDFCLVRYNADGTIDTGFGGFSFPYGNPPNFFTHILSPGRSWIKSGIDEDGTIFGSGSELLDMAIQPDGKIIVVGYTHSKVAPYFQGVGVDRQEGIIARFNSNGTLDTSFGLNSSGIARFTGANTGTAGSPCYAFRAFYGVRLQPDGRIIAVGYDGTTDAQCFRGSVFVVTRWNANGTLETVRRVDSNTSVFANERAVSALISNDGGRLLVSGQYQGNGALARFNLSDLSIDGTFGTSGVIRYLGTSTAPMYIKAIQTDSKIVGVDSGSTTGLFRLNSNGSPDNSFGNQAFDGSNPNGRLNLLATTFNTTAPISVGHVLLRPNGRLNFIGSGTANEGGNSPRALVSQNLNVSRPNINADFTNDGRADLGVFRGGTWYYLNSANNQFNAFAFGQAGDAPAPADYDGDGRADIAVFRAGTWYLIQSSNNQFRGVAFGASGDLPRPGDFDGDGKADFAVFRPSAGAWYILRSSDNSFQGLAFGQNGDVPVIADFDGDGKSDVAVFRNGTWYYLQSSNGQFVAVAFGAAGDSPVVGDYDGDSRSDVAVFRPSNGYWYRLNSSNGAFVQAQFGQNGDKAVPGDYDDDGKNDLAVFRSGTWYVLRSGDNSVAGTSFGTAGDIPVPAAYLP